MKLSIVFAAVIASISGAAAAPPAAKTVPAKISAPWDAPGGGGITTEGKDLRELQEQVTDAVRCRFVANPVLIDCPA
jgi:hypothetical protein